MASTPPPASGSSAPAPTEHPTGDGMDQLIPVINKLQDVFNAIGGDDISLPQIVVVGSQSSGKSSVLESIVGRDFLPRGSGIVTRRPLLLQLIHTPKVEGADEKLCEWGEFLHKQNERFYDFNKIREEIEAETDRSTGRNKGVSPTPIRLRIFSPHVLNLTLVDLPGMTRVPVGDQPADIEQQIRSMIRSYITKPTTVILAVTAANTDISNSDALQLAREVDPEGNRSIGVITKIDIMDRGTDALDVLLGRVIPLKLGYVGVINRSQQDIVNRKSIRDALKYESEYFATHPLYRSIANRMGTRFLTKTLNRVLLSHIRECLPELKQKINKMKGETENEMASYGDSSMFESTNNRGAMLLQILTKFSADYTSAIDGNHGELATNELFGGARINYIFTECFANCLDRMLHDEGVTEIDIQTAIKNATGPRSSLFVPEAAFELLARQQIARLKNPSLDCVEFVYDELQRIVGHIESQDLQRFAVLRERTVEVVNDLLHKCKVPARKMISNLISMELAYINTNHPDFLGGGGAISKIFENMAMAQQQEVQRQQQMQQQQMQQQQQQQQPPQGGMMRPGGPPGPQGGMPPGAQPQGGQPPMGAGVPPGGAIPPAAGQADSGFSRFFGPGSNAGAPPGRPGAPVARPGQPPMGQPAARPAHPQFGQSGAMSAPGGLARLEQVPTTIKAGGPASDKERFEIELIHNLLSSYFNIVRKNIQDAVPKAIMHFLVNSSKENIQNELVRALYKEDLLEELLEESPEIAHRRKNCRTLLDVLKRASDILNEVRDFNPTRM